MIDRLTIDKIMDAARIEDVVGDFVTLKRAGANFKGLCPFHDDRTPSFMVSPAKNYCKCFACGKGGNPVGFIMEHEQLTYPDALRWLAKKYGITIQEKELSEEEMQQKDDRESMFIVNEWANQWFQNELYDTEDGRAIGLSYFRERGFRDDILKKFQVGYCPNKRGHSLSADALKAGYQERYLINTPGSDIKNTIGTGLCFKNDRGELRDRFFDRVIWPIFTVSGKVAGFGGRVLAKETKGVNIKYQNSPESIIYSKRRELYGLFQAKMAINKKDLCYLVEGYTDVMAMHQSGVENVVASSGTALTDEQIRLIHRFTSNIVVIYDGDAAGIKASQRGIDMLLAQGMNVKLLLLPDGDDPDSFSRKHNAQEFQDYLASHQIDFIKFKTNLLLEEAQGDPVAMSKLVNNIVQSIAVIPDEITRSIYIKETSSTMKIEERLIASAVQKQLANNREEWKKQKEREENRKLMGLDANMAPPPSESQETTEGDDWVPPTSEQPGETVVQPEVAINNQPLINSIQQKRMMHLYQKELEIVRAIVKYGQQVMCMIEDEEGKAVPLTVLKYISIYMEQNNLSLQTELHKQMIQEGMAHLDEQDFIAEKYFLNHPDVKINSLAFELTCDKVQLSKLHDKNKKTSTEGEVSLTELLPHVMTDFQLEVIKQEMEDVMKELRDPSIMQDSKKYMEVLTKFKEIKDREKELSKIRGDRVLC